MAKRKKNKKYSSQSSTKAPPSISSQSEEDRANLAASELAAGNYRKARDLYRALHKEAPNQLYLDGLIESNASLAREMMAKGQTGSVKQVIDYLKTLPGTEDVVDLLSLSSAFAQEQWDTVRDLASHAMDSGHGTRLVFPTVTVVDALVLADVLPKDLAKVGNNDDSVTNWRSDWLAILSAMRSLTASHFPEAAETLRPIGRKSEFAEWKMLLRGIIAYYDGELETAERFFTSIKSRTLAAKTAQQYRGVANIREQPEAISSLSNDQIAVLAAFANVSPQEIEVLIKADELWRKQKPIQSYKEIRRIRRKKDSSPPRWTRVLDDFYATATKALPDWLTRDYNTYFGAMLLGHDYLNDTEAFLAARMGQEMGTMDYEYTGHFGDPFIKFAKELFGPWPKLESQTWLKIGKKFHECAKRTHSFYLHSAGKSQSMGKAERYLDKAIEINPKNLDAHLALLSVYTADKTQSRHNKLLDSMVEDFPDSKVVCQLAGVLAIERKSYVKGLKFLERARQIDPLDTDLASLVLYAYEEQALEYYKKGRLNNARKALSEAETLLNNSRSAAIHHQIRGALLEQAYGDSEKGEIALEKILSESDSISAMGFYAVLMAFHYDKKLGQTKLKVWNKTWSKSTTLSDCISFIQITDAFNAVFQQNKLTATQINKMMQKGLKEAYNNPFTRKDLLEYLSLEEIQYTTLPLEIRPFLKVLQKKHKKDPALKLADYIIFIRPISIDLLKNLENEASNDKDFEAVSFIQNYRKRHFSENKQSNPFYGGNSDEDEEEDYGEEEEDINFDLLNSNIPKEEQAHLMQSFFFIVSNLRKEDLEHFKKVLAGLIDHKTLDQIHRLGPRFNAKSLSFQTVLEAMIKLTSDLGFPVSSIFTDEIDEIAKPKKKKKTSPPKGSKSDPPISEQLDLFEDF